MSKKTLILSQSQLNEIIGGSYLNTAHDDFNPQGSQIYTNTYSCQGSDCEYFPAKDTDDYSQNMVNQTGGFSPFFTRGHLQPVHGMMESNQDIANKDYKFSPTAISTMTKSPIAKDSVALNGIQNGISGKNLPEYVHRFRKAKKEAEMGNPEKLNNMGGILASNEIERLYKQVLNQSKNKRNSNGNRIKSAPKESGNGKGHNNNNITYYN